MERKWSQFPSAFVRGQRTRLKKEDGEMKTEISVYDVTSQSDHRSHESMMS